MDDDYFSALKLIASVKDDVDSISCDAVLNRYVHCHHAGLMKHSSPLRAGLNLMCLSCSVQYFVAIRFVALVSGLHMQRM
jgi:hypothetical protein